MSIEFGWWNRDDGAKYQVRVIVHGGNIEWSRKQGHHASWETYQPNTDDRGRLVEEAKRRLPRRLISEKQFREIARLAERRTRPESGAQRPRQSPAAGPAVTFDQIRRNDGQ